MSVLSPHNRAACSGNKGVLSRFAYLICTITEPDRDCKREIKLFWRSHFGLKTTMAFLFILFFVCASDAATMEEAFWSRNWGAMDSIYRAALSEDEGELPNQKITSRDISLYANGLWTQRRYAEGLTLLENAKVVFPPSLVPYAAMLSVLGMERTGRKGEAFDAGGALWASAPEPIRYYLAYAMGRLARDLQQPDEALSWFRRMLEISSGDKKRRVDALRELLALPGVTAEEAALLLIDQPSNAKALAICKGAAKGTNSKIDYALGYHAYTRKNYDEANERLALAYKDGRYGEAARYYHAYSLFRQKKNSKAFSIWSGVALYGDDYPQRSVQRLSTLASNGMKSEVLQVLRKIAATRGGYPELAADALAAIVRFGDEATARNAEAELASKYPATNQAATAQWEKGWKAWNDGNYRAAEKAWEKGYNPGIKNKELASRLLYWRARALENLGESGVMEKMGEVLAHGFPGEYYTYLLRTDGGLSSADIPAAYTGTNDLEEWGFVTYARLESVSKENAENPAAQFRAVRLSHWEGDFGSSVRAFAVFQRMLKAEELSSAALLKYAYPRAFESEVAAAAGKTGLDPAIIWGVMRQESLYEPDVTSIAGAYGLMQLMPGTAKGESQKMKLPEDAYKRPSDNILLGSNHMVGLIARFKDLPRSFAAYNAGGTPVNRWSKERISDMAEWIENIPYYETRGYVKAVMRNVAAYRALYRAK